VYNATSSAPLFVVATPITNAYSIAPSSEQYIGFQLITFDTPVLEANTTVAANVSLCCRGTPAKDPFDAPSVFILSASDYSEWQTALNRNPLNAFPSTSPYEATTFGCDNLKNYTYNGSDGNEVIRTRFLTRETAVYCYLVIAKGESSFSLDMIASGWQTIHPYDWIFHSVTVLAAGGGVILAWMEGEHEVTYSVAGLAVIVALVLLLVFLSLASPNRTETVSSRGFGPDSAIALLAAVPGVISLAILIYKGWPRIAIEVVTCSHQTVSSSNLNGTSMSIDILVRNKSDSPTTLYKAVISVNNISQTFDLGLSTRTFPYVARGTVVLGHDIIGIPLFFNFEGSTFPVSQACDLVLWHAHGRKLIHLTSVLS